jgi:hypothetical protein
MTRRRAIAGLCMLCALALSATVVQSAGATTNGTTAFTCVKGAGTLKGEHCLTTGGAPAEYGHVAIAGNTTTEVIATNSKTSNETKEATNMSLKATVGGVELKLQATGWEGSGWLENAKDATGEHYVRDGGLVKFTGVTVAAPAGKGCNVFTDETATKTKGPEGVITTGPLAGTSLGQGDGLKFSGAEGGPFASFFLECTTKVPALEGTREITGSVIGKPDGATVAFDETEITLQATLKCGGNKAGFEGRVTIRGKDPIAEDKVFTPISVTTVETP